MDILGILHRVVDAAHHFQIKLEIFDEKINKNEFGEAKKILSQLEHYLLYLYNPLNTDYISSNYDTRSECYNNELKDLVEEYIVKANDSEIPGVCLFKFAELYNKRAYQFQEMLHKHTLSQFKSALINPKFNVNDLRDLLMNGSSNYLSKSILSLEKILDAQLSLDSKSVNYKADSTKSKDLTACKIDLFLDVVALLSKLDFDFSKDLIYYSFRIICKNLISEFDHLEAGDIIDRRIPKDLHFDPNLEFRKIANEAMSFHYITIASQFFESEQGFSRPIFTDKLSGFSQLINKLISECERLCDHELTMRVHMIMACICAYSSSFGRLIIENKNDIDKLLYIFSLLTLIKTEISKMIVRIEFRPIIASLDYSQSISELALKEILRNINNELSLDMNKGYSMCVNMINRLSNYPILPSFNRMFNFIIDIIHFNLIRYVYKSLEDGYDIDDLFENCQRIIDFVSETKHPFVHRDSELRAKSRILLKVLDNRNVDILEFTGCFFSDEEILHLRRLVVN